jgi:HPr kinase/phosphorylase
MGDKKIQVSRLFSDCRDELGLEVLTGGAGLEKAVRKPEISRPGLALAGFEEGLPSDEIVVLGRSEVLYLNRMDAEAMARAFGALLAKQPPCIVLTRGMALSQAAINQAAGGGTAVLATPRSPTETVRHLSNYLLMELAPDTSINATLVDVYGIGILIRGKSGIGKSECALDLVERGHRLVADDMVRVTAKPPGVLIGRSPEPLQDFVEVRGIGPVDIGSIFGIRALRRQKRIEIEVNLRLWGEEGLSYDRSGLERKQVEILGVKIASITVPLVAGKSISVIIEVIALSHILSSYGYDAAESLRNRVRERLRQSGGTGFVPTDVE